MVSSLGLTDWTLPLQSPAPQWLLPGILQREALHILTSDTGCCKTWLALTTLLSGLYEIPVIGIAPSRGFSSLYLAADSPAWDIGQQLSKLLAAHSLAGKVPSSDAHAFFMPFGFSFERATDIANVCNFIKEWDIDVFIIDVMLYTHNGDENDNSHMSRTVLHWAKVIRDRTGCAIFFLHHNAKPKVDGSVSYRGAGTLVQAVEHHLSLTRSGRAITLRTGKIRGDEDQFPSELYFTLGRRGGGRLLSRLDSPTIPNPLLELLRSRPHNRTELQDWALAQGRAPLWLDSALQYQKKAGRITQTPEGAWTLAALNQ